ncbi:secretory phospholipase A2 receptor [Aplochiton taeniatus]
MRIQLCQVVESSAALVTIFTVLFVNSCACVNEEDEVMDKIQLAELYSKGLFVLESTQLKRCISAERSNLVLYSCERPTRRMLWKWVSQHRLFNLGTSTCLGLNASDANQPLGTFECDSAPRTLWWRCNGNTLYGAFQMKLSVAGRLVVVKKSSYHQWRRYSTPGEGPCSYPYQDTYTLLGNGHGMPCAFPFKYNNKWYSECTAEGREDHHLWCATTSRYDEAEKWGFCPSQDSSCDTFWDASQEQGACYQFNLYTILTWSQALSSCQAQGGNLLSVTDLAEHSYIRDRLADFGVMVWIGLNHLSEGRGWQWSDGAPLALVNFTTGLSPSPIQDNRQCGVYNSVSGGHWQSLSCESALPYICKKTPNHTRRAEPIEHWQYYNTVCAEGWLAHNSLCYRVLGEAEEAMSWEESSRACDAQGANLTSLHSLSEVEALLDLLANVSGGTSEAWIGLRTQPGSPVVEWADGSPVSMTQWDQYQPVHSPGTDPLCVKVDRKGHWLLAACEEKLAVVCRKAGLSPHHTGTWDEGCPEGWKRRGHSCYLVTSHKQNYEDAVKGYYCKAPLLTIENRFEQAFVNSLLSESGANGSVYYWTALQDLKRTGEYSWLGHNGSSLPLAFTHWNKHQPASAGGCVAMTGGRALGHWEVKDCKSQKALSVCKQSISSYRDDEQLPAPHVDAYAPCPPGWESRSGLVYCFKVFHSEKVLMKRSWAEADFFCQALGAQLASFHHYEDQAFLKEALQSMFEGTEGRWFWVGLNKRDPESYGAWQWSDGTPVVSSFIEDKNEDEDRFNCAVYSDLTNALLPQPCDTKHEWVCKVPRGVELKKPYWYTDHSESWVFHHGAEYLFVAQPLFPWPAVSLACQMMGGHLLSLHSREELRFVRERMAKLSKGSTDWWIGLSYDLTREMFSWSDGSELDYQNWEEGSSPGDSAKQKLCTTMSSLSGKWLAGACGGRHGYMCKRCTVSVMEVPREPHYIGGCPERWLYFGHKCLLLHLPNSPEEGKSWRDAQSICSSFQGSLVAIEDEIEQAYVTMLLQGGAVGVWIGLRDEDTMKWTNGRPVSYTNWSPVEPKSSLAEEKWLSDSLAVDQSLCTVLSNNHNYHLTGKWYDAACTESAYGFVCQKPQDTSKPPTHSYLHPLPDNIEYRGRSYRVVPGNMSWYEALHTCLENESELVSITDPFHQAFLTVLVNRLAVPHWIGLYQDDGINYQWSDGSDTLYTNWEAVEEEDYVAGECVFMDVNGGWRRADCESPLPGALCHLPPPKSDSFHTYELSCPSDWLKFGSGCYSFDPVIQRLNLKEARQHCRQKVNTSDVLTIKTEMENRFVQEQLWLSSGFPNQQVWLGMYFNTDTESMGWFDGSPVEYTNWHYKPPDASMLSVDTCVTTRVSDGVWSLAPCTDQLGFVCTTHSDIITEVEVEPLNGLHHGVVPAAVLVAILFFAVLVGVLWFVYKKNHRHFHRIPTLGNAYYRQTDSQATDSDGNVLIRDLETHPGE